MRQCYDFIHANEQIILFPSSLIQDYASNSRHSSLRGSVRSSTVEEHPVNPVVSVSVLHTATNLCCSAVFDCTTGSILSALDVQRCMRLYAFICLLFSVSENFSMNHVLIFACHSIDGPNISWAASRLGGEARQ